MCTCFESLYNPCRSLPEKGSLSPKCNTLVEGGGEGEREKGPLQGWLPASTIVGLAFLGCKKERAVQAKMRHHHAPVSWVWRGVVFSARVLATLCHLMSVTCTLKAHILLEGCRKCGMGNYHNFVFN